MKRKNSKKMKETKKEILETLKKKGPSLPVHISRNTDVDMIFASAFLSELVSNKKVKISDMKVGGSPIYYLPGQKKDLEKYFKYLGNREKEAFQRLKEKKILDDEKEKPVVRVALRNLKDFADSLKIEKNGQEKIYWKFYNISEEEARKRITGNGTEEKEENKNSVDENKIEEKEKSRNSEIINKEGEKGERKKTEDKNEKDTKNIEQDEKKNSKNLLEIKKKKQKEGEKGEDKNKENNTKSNEEYEEDEDEDDEKENGKNIEKVEGPEFVKKVIKVLKNKNIKILEEKEKKKREYISIIKTDSNIGEIKFLCIGRDLKRISDRHISLMLQKSREENLPVYLVTTAKKFTKKAKKYLEDYSGMVNVEKIG